MRIDVSRTLLPNFVESSVESFIEKRTPFDKVAGKAA
jgi:hypothetical protein